MRSVGRNYTVLQGVVYLLQKITGLLAMTPCSKTCNTSNCVRDPFITSTGVFDLGTGIGVVAVIFADVTCHASVATAVLVREGACLVSVEQDNTALEPSATVM